MFFGGKPPPPPPPFSLFEPGACGAVPYFETSAGDPPAELYALFGRYTVYWGVLWLACGGFAKAFIMPRLPHSTKPHENSSMYIGQKIVTTFKNALIAALANLAMYSIITADSWSRDLEFGGYPLIEVSGVLFTSFETADLVLCLVFRFLDTEMVVHHLIHIFLGLLIRGNCAPALTASILMAQETSGVPLNYYLALRHRMPEHRSIIPAQSLFAMCFFAWRLLIGTYGTVHYVLYAAEFLPPAFPSMQARALGVALVLASVLQWYWGVAIIKMIARKISGKAKPKP